MSSYRERFMYPQIKSFRSVPSNMFVLQSGHPHEYVEQTGFQTSLQIDCPDEIVEQIDRPKEF